MAADVDAAYEQGVASVTPEDGVSQADLDSASTELASVQNELVFWQDQAYIMEQRLHGSKN